MSILEGMHLSSQPTPVHPILKQLFNSRKMEPDEIAELLSWDLKQLPSLVSLVDLDKGAKRILKAIEQEETIGIYGDYDVDGTTACALFYRFFELLNLKNPIRLYQPHRIQEGYGLHSGSIDQALTHKVDLLITVDCGITNTEPARYAKERGMDLIITDHHKDSAPELPPAFAVINPNRRNETCHPDLKSLAGVGVAFALCVRIRELLIASKHSCPSLFPLLPFVAIGTLCDMVKLNPMNLKLVRHGLRAIKSTSYEGLKKLFPPKEREKDPIPSEYISFCVGPLINSRGRLAHPKKALELLTTNDPDQAFEIFNELKLCNQERKNIQSQVTEEAKKQIIEQMNGKEHCLSIAYKPSWHEGVIGIVASKMVETFKVPAIIFCESQQEKGLLKGSARTAGSFNIHEALCQHKDLLTKFGGHTAAAGMSLPAKNLPTLASRLQEYIRSTPPATRRSEERCDLKLSINDISSELALNLELLEPFGSHNSKPIFQIKNAVIESFQILKDLHVLWKIKNPKTHKVFKGISFFFIGQWGRYSPEELMNLQRQGRPLTIQFTLGFNHFQSNKFLQLEVLSLFP